MNELQKDFLNHSTAGLEALQKKLDAAAFQENDLREMSRTLHTIKGSAQVFGCGRIGNLAHEIENLLQAAREKRVSPDEIFYSLLREGLRHLTEMCRQKLAKEKLIYPKTFVEKLRQTTESELSAKGFPLDLPLEILTQLSQSEKDFLGAAIENGKNLFLIEADFDFENLEHDFKEFRRILSEAGEIAAAFPNKQIFPRIGFRVLFLTEESFAEISRNVSPFEAEINFKIESEEIAFASQLGGILSQVVEGAEKLSGQFGKEIEFDASFSEIEIPAKQLKTLFGALLHLTRNAVDHGIEKRGKITIKLEPNATGLHLMIADDGRGIDLERIKAKAVERNLISPDARLSEKEIINLIFAHGFSTRETVSKTSGRGVGLDAVKDLVEKANGKIIVKSERNVGTTFEIFLPNEK